MSVEGGFVANRGKKDPLKSNAWQGFPQEKKCQLIALLKGAQEAEKAVHAKAKAAGQASEEAGGTGWTVQLGTVSKEGPNLQKNVHTPRDEAWMIIYADRGLEFKIYEKGRTKMAVDELAESYSGEGKTTNKAMQALLREHQAMQYIYDAAQKTAEQQIAAGVQRGGL